MKFFDVPMCILRTAEDAPRWRWSPFRPLLSPGSVPLHTSRECPRLLHFFRIFDDPCRNGGRGIGFSDREQHGSCLARSPSLPAVSDAISPTPHCSATHLRKPPQGSHRVDHCSPNRNPEHHPDPALPSLRTEKEHDDSPPTMDAAAKNRGIRAFSQVLQALHQRLDIFLVRSPPARVRSARRFDTEVCGVCCGMALTNEQLSAGECQMDQLPDHRLK